MRRAGALRHARAGTAGLLLALTLAACGDDPTQLVVVIDSDLAVPRELDRVEAVVMGPTSTSQPLAAELAGADALALPLSFAVVPETGTLGPVTVEARGLAAGRPVVTARARTTLVRGQSRLLRLFLARSCTRQSCAAGRTCRDGACADVEIPWSELPAWDGHVPPRDAGPRLDDAGRPLDAGRPDAAPTEGGPPPDTGPAPDGGRPDGGPPAPCSGGCDDLSACTLDACDEAAGRCVHTPRDADGDGHGDAACGGDDCDDADPTRFPGAVEACDGIDDDCNGTPDDGCPCTPLGAREDCTTPCGSTGSRTCNNTGWGDCEPPAESCNVLDDDCDGQVDEGFAYVASATRRLTNDGDASRRPTLAVAPDRLGVAWQRDSVSGAWQQVELAVLDLDGAPMGATRVASALSGAPARTPDLAWAGDRFAATWWEGASARGDGVALRLFMPDGSPIGSAVRVEDTGLGTPAAPATAWSGSQLGIVYEDGDLYLEQTDARGMLPGGRTRVAAPADVRAEIVWAAGSWAIAYPDADRVQVAIGDSFFDTRSVGFVNGAEDVGLAVTGAGLVVAAGGDTGQLRAFASTDAGRSFGPEAALTGSRAVGTTCFASDDAPVPVVAAGTEQVLVFWAEHIGPGSRIWMARLSADGTVLQPPGEVATAGGQDVQPDAAWLGARAALVWASSDGSCAAQEIWFATVGCP